MARKEVQKVIDEVKYTFYRHLPDESLVLFNRLVRIIAPTTVSSVDKETINDLLWGDTEKEDFTVDLVSGINALCLRLNEKEVKRVFDSVLGKAVHNGKSGEKGKGNCRDNYNAVFIDASIPHVYKVVYAALEVEYADFFGDGVDLGAMVGQVRDLIPAKQQ